MPNSDSDARDVVPREPAPTPAQTGPDQKFADDSLAPQIHAANDPDPLPPKAKPGRRKKPDDAPTADAAGLLDMPVPPAASDAQQVAPARPRSPPRRKPAKAASASPAGQDEPELRPEPVEAPDLSTPQAPASSPLGPVMSAAAADHPFEGTAVDGGTAPAGQPDAAAALADAGRPQEVRDAAPAPVMPAPKVGTEPGKLLTISALDAALAIVNPHPIRANDRPDGYLYHLTSPQEAKVLLQSGLPCSFDDPIILTERGGIPYWMSVLAEDVDDILDGPAAVTVLRVRRRAVQNALESDADSSRAAQAPCYLLTGVSNLPPVPAAAPPLLRARPPAPTGDAAESGSGVETAGTVKWYNPRKGFGFITPGSGGKDVFVHASTLERAGLAQLTDGQSVRMQVIQGAKGPEAASLSLA